MHLSTLKVTLKWFVFVFMFASVQFLAPLVTEVQARTIETEPNDSVDTATNLDTDLTLIADFKEKRDIDFISFELSDALALWRFQASGEGVVDMELIDPGGNTLASISKSGRMLRLSNVLLPSGRYSIKIRGDSGRYIFRVTNQGPPPQELLDTAKTETSVPVQQTSADKVEPVRDPEAGPKVNELEPNDQIADAVEIQLEERRSGLLDRRKDIDNYRFSLLGQMHVQITFEPADQSIKADLSRYWGSKSAEAIRIDVPNRASHPGPLVWNALLEPGDYFLQLASKGVTEKPYAITVSRQSFFTRPTDLEPNNNFFQARPIPADGVLRGHATRDYDYYLLSTQNQDQTIKVIASGTQENVNALKFRLSFETTSLLPGEWKARTTKRNRQITREDERSWTLHIPANQQAAFGVRHGPAAGAPAGYEIQLEDFSKSNVADVSAKLNLETDRIAAYSRYQQTINGTLHLHNQSELEQELNINAHVEDVRWAIAIPQKTLLVTPQQMIEIPFQVFIPADAWDLHPIAIAIGIFDAKTAALISSAEARIIADPEATEAASGVVWQAPEQLLGSLNLAWSALGASVTSGREKLIDGFSVPQSSLSLHHKHLNKQDLNVKLPGDTVHRIMGVGLNHPKGKAAPNRLMRRFRVDVFKRW